jgi:hypothetical protein
MTEKKINLTLSIRQPYAELIMRGVKKNYFIFIS